MIFCPRKRPYLLRHTSAAVVFASLNIDEAAISKSMKIFHHFLVSFISGIRNALSSSTIWKRERRSQENIMLHWSKLVDSCYNYASHSLHSPGLAHCDFFLFPNMKKWLAGNKFTSNEEIIAGTKDYFAV